MSVRERQESVFVVRPRLNRGAKAGPAAAGMLILCLGFTLKHRGTALVAQVLLDVAAVAATFLWLQLGKKRLRFVLERSRLLFVGRFSQREVFSRGTPGRVLEVTVVLVGKATMSFWSLVDANGVSRVAVNADAFDPADLDELRSRLSIPREKVEAPMKAREARERYPGLIPWWVAHLVAVYCAGFVLLCVVVGVVSHS